MFGKASMDVPICLVATFADLLAYLMKQNEFNVCQKSINTLVAGQNF